MADKGQPLTQLFAEAGAGLATCNRFRGWACGPSFCFNLAGDHLERSFLLELHIGIDVAEVQGDIDVVTEGRLFHREPPGSVLLAFKELNVSLVLGRRA